MREVPDGRGSGAPRTQAQTYIRTHIQTRVQTQEGSPRHGTLLASGAAEVLRTARPADA